MNRDGIVYMTIKSGLSIRGYNSPPLPIVNLQLWKALTDTFYDPRASSLPANTLPSPAHAPTKHLLAPQGGVQFQTVGLIAKTSSVSDLPSLLPFFSSPPLLASPDSGGVKCGGGSFQWKTLKKKKSERSQLTMTPLATVIQE